MGTNDLGRGLCICEGFHDEVPTRQQQWWMNEWMNVTLP
jgi:hypothetical protein